MGAGPSNYSSTVAELLWASCSSLWGTGAASTWRLAMARVRISQAMHIPTICTTASWRRMPKIRPDATDGAIDLGGGEAATDCRAAVPGRADTGTNGVVHVDAV